MGGQSAAAVVDGEGVQEAVGGRVVGLSGGAEQTGRRGEQDEGGQIHVPCQLVQMPGGVGLGSHDAVHALGRQRLQGAVVEDTGRVDDGGQRMVLLHDGQESGQGLPVRRVARGEGDLGAQGAQFGGEFRRALRSRAAAACQQ